MRKKFVAISLVMVLSMSALFGCSENNNKEQETTKTTQESTEGTGNTGTAVSTTATESEGYDDEDYTRVFVSEKLSSEDGVTTLASTSANTIYLNGSSIKSEVSGTNVDGSTVTITQPGVYILTGTLEDGQIVVDCSEKGTVELVFNNVEITNKTNSPVYIKDAKKTLIVLAENSENTLTDAEDYTYEDAEKEEPSACLFSKDDLVISGGGSLIVNANFNNGIASKDTLKITGGTIQVTAKNNAIKGKDSLMIAGGDFAIQSEGDGLKADNSDDATFGYIDISGGTFAVRAEQDGIQASSFVNITNPEPMVDDETLSSVYAVPSVRSEVTNIRRHLSAGTVTDFKEKAFQYFSKSQSVSACTREEIEAVNQLREEKYIQKEWIYSR